MPSFRFEKSRKENVLVLAIAIPGFEYFFRSTRFVSAKAECCGAEIHYLSRSKFIESLYFFKIGAQTLRQLVSFSAD